MTNAPEVAPPSTVKSTNHFGARAVLAAISLALVAIPGALTLLLVKDRWTPLLRAAWVAAMAALFNAMRVDRGHRSVDVREGLEPEPARLP